MNLYKDKVDINKIQKILEVYKENDAKAWEIGTDFYGSWTRLINNINKIPSDLIKNSKLDKLEIKEVDSNVDQPRFKMYIGDYDITPKKHTKNYQSVAKSTIRQFLQEGSALSFLAFSDNDLVNDKSTFNLNPSIWGLVGDSKQSLNFYLILSLKNSIGSGVKYITNFGYSLFLSLIDSYNEKNNINIFNQISNHIVSPKQNKKVRSKFHNCDINTKEAQEFIKHVKGIATNNLGTGKRTYVVACEELLSEYKFEDIVNYIYDVVIHIDDLNYSSDFLIIPESIQDQQSNNKEFMKLCQDIIQEIRNARNKLKDNILLNRIGLDNRNQTWTDLDNSSPNKISFNLMEACHIYDINKIIREFRNYAKNINDLNTIDKEKFIIEASDFNNGILLNPFAHRLFDRGVVWFNEDGQLCYRNESKDAVEAAFGHELDKVKINNDILTEQMKEYILKKNKR